MAKQFPPVETGGTFLRAVIFANGPVPDRQSINTHLQPDDRLIAADGGARHCLALGLQPAVVIGDFDSLDESEIETLRGGGAEMVRHPRAKDQTDLELALRYAVTEGAEQVLVFGGLGGRWDQTITNLLLPALPELTGTRIWLIEGRSRATLLHSGEELHFDGLPGDVVSLVPLGGSAHGISTRDLEYPLDGETVTFGSTLAISNTMLRRSGLVRIESGTLAVFITAQSDENDSEEG
jgi:thiamine pyrophosphokinase